MKIVSKHNKGFTIIETLMVLAMLGIVMGAIFSLYITHLKNAYAQDETIEMQQNLRMAMESISRTLKNAGTLVPLTTTPLEAFGNSSSSVQVNTASSDGVYARSMTNRTNRASNFAIYSSKVDSTNGFSAGDKVRLINPLAAAPVFATYTTILISDTPTAQSLHLTGSGVFVTGSDVKPGDIFAKAASTTAPRTHDSVLFFISSGTIATGLVCPTNQQCLVRSTNGTPEILASYISKLRFSYIDESGTESATAPAELNTIRSVRVTIDGIATTSTGPKYKQLTSLIMLRNKR